MNTEQMGIFGYIRVSIIKVGTKYWNNAYLNLYLPIIRNIQNSQFFTFFELFYIFCSTQFIMRRYQSMQLWQTGERCEAIQIVVG